VGRDRHIFISRENRQGLARYCLIRVALTIILVPLFFMAMQPILRGEELDEKIVKLRLSDAITPSPPGVGPEGGNLGSKGLSALCGNEIVDQGEECDDGNVEDGDGCSSTCLIEGSFCGNGTLEEGEECGEKGVPPCPEDKTCEKCRCVGEMDPELCGNGAVDPGEECEISSKRVFFKRDSLCPGDEACINCRCVETECDPDSCGDGEVIDLNTCKCMPNCVGTSLGKDVCNDHNPCTQDRCLRSGECMHQVILNGLSCSDGNLCNGSEQCVGGVCQPGVPVNCDDGVFCNGPETCNPEFGCQPATQSPCAAGQFCNALTESCDPACGTIQCPTNPSCVVPYCVDSDGNCTFDDPEQLSGGGVTMINYDSGSRQVSKCCLGFSYIASVGVDPCTGDIDGSTYNVTITSIIPAGGAGCGSCPAEDPSEEGGGVIYIDEGGNTVRCVDFVDPAGLRSVTFIPGSGKPQVRVECSDCCGGLRTHIETLNSAPSQPPINCGQSDCPGSRGDTFGGA